MVGGKTAKTQWDKKPWGGMNQALRKWEGAVGWKDYNEFTVHRRGALTHVVNLFATLGLSGSSPLGEADGISCRWRHATHMNALKPRSVRSFGKSSHFQMLA